MTNETPEERFRRRHLGEKSLGEIVDKEQGTGESKEKKKYFSRLGGWLWDNTAGLAWKGVKHAHREYPRASKAVDAAVVVGLLTGGWFFHDYITKRQDFPSRNILYQCQAHVNFEGGELGKSAEDIDKISRYTIHRGEERGTKIGDKLATFVKNVTDEMDHYRLENLNNRRLAFATAKSERLQAGTRLRGYIDFGELQSKMFQKPASEEELKGDQSGPKFITFSFIPERGWNDRELHVLMDENDDLHLVNELVTYRHNPLAAIWGTNFRSGTALYDFDDTPENNKKKKRILDGIQKYMHSELSLEDREDFIDELLGEFDKLDRTPVYVSHEDGIIKWLPQESTTYLFSDPTVLERRGQDWHDWMAWWGLEESPTTVSAKAKPVQPEKEQLVRSKPLPIDNPDGSLPNIRVEQHWDFWPGNYPLLNRITFGSERDVIRPFGHENNGGYTIEDSHGVIARVDIQDFMLYYGNDVLYLYYVDKNGNGVIEEDIELVGKVLYRTSHDETADQERQIGEKRAKTTITKSFFYTFMAGANWDTRFEDFYLCNAVESSMPNELNRGFGKHSRLGWINHQRSNILLLEARTVPNLARALTPESALVAKDDLIALLRAAGRDYVEGYIKKDTPTPAVQKETAAPAYQPATKLPAQPVPPVVTPEPPVAEPPKIEYQKEMGPPAPDIAK